MAYTLKRDGSPLTDSDKVDIRRDIGLGTSATLNVGTASGTVAAGDDSRLTDAREWTAATVDQAEAEAGTATTRRAWTAQRVAQAIAAWWSGLTLSPSKVTMATARLLGRATAGSGGAEEITVGTGLSLSAGALTATGGVATVTPAAVPYTFSLSTVDASGTSDPQTFGFCGNAGVLSNGAAPIAGPYYDHTAFLGFNLKNEGVQNDVSRPAFGLGWESKFTQNGGTEFAHELYLRCLRTNGVEFRPFGGYFPYGGVGNIFSLVVSRLTIDMDNGTNSGVPAYLFDNANKATYIYRDQPFIFSVNNFAPIRQRNAANSADVNLPYIDASDKLILGNQRATLTPTVSASTFALAINTQGTSVSTALGLEISFAAQTNVTIEAARFSGSTNYIVTSTLAWNTHASGGAVSVTRAGGAAASQYVNADSSKTWCVGKNSAGNFEIGESTQLEANPVLRIISSTRNLSFGAITSFGGASGAIAVANAATVPTTNPTGGGILYAEGGALKWRGSSGTVTTIAPA